MVADSTLAEPTATSSDAASDRRAPCGSRAPIARAISATQAEPTANRTDCESWKNCVA